MIKKLITERNLTQQSLDPCFGIFYDYLSTTRHWMIILAIVTGVHIAISGAVEDQIVQVYICTEPNDLFRTSD
jgi:hypothetical protein